MATRSKSKVAGSKNIQAIVKRMIEADDLSEEGVMPEDFKSLDATEFVRTVAKYKANALGSSDYANNLVTYAWADAEIANALLQKYEEAFPALTGEEFESAADALRIDLDFGVMGSDVMAPKILPNGAVLIRNHHRVIALSDSPELSLKIDSKQLHAELTKLLKDKKFDGSDESRFDFLVLHRNGHRSAIATQSLPDTLSEFGQTLIFIGRNLDLSASDLLSQCNLDGVQSGSRIGMAVLRTFSDRCLVYSTFRHSDDFDTVLEEYAEASFHDLDDEQSLDLCMDYRKLGEKVSARTQERLESTDIKRPSGFSGYLLDYVLISTHNYNSYASEKRKQISSLRPFFAPSMDRPVHYCYDSDPYWDLSEEFNHQFAMVTVPLDIFESIDQFEQEFEKVVVKNYLKAGKFPKHDNLLLIEEARFAFKDDLVKPTSTKAKEWLKKQAQNMRDAWGESSNDYDDQKEFMRDQSMTVDIALLFAQRPDPQVLNSCMKRASASCDVGGALAVPHLGFFQGYDCGDYDTGNAPDLLCAHDDE